MNIIKTKIDKVKKAEYNPRTISEKELANLKKSISRFGIVRPVVINKKTDILVSGHQTIKAAKELGIDEVPAIYVNITKKEEKALNLALNRISGDWDMDKLFEVIDELRVTEELDFTGFDDKEISKILDMKMEEEDEDESLEEMIKKAPAKAKKGDIYQLGKHRLMCGDSTSIDDVEKLTQGNLMDMVFTDPPYNVAYQSSDPELGSIKNDNMNEGQFSDFMESVFTTLWTTLKQGACAYICSGWQSFSTFVDKMRITNYHISEVIIWVKNQAGIHTLEYPHKHEQIIKGRKVMPKKKKKGTAIIYGWKKGKHKYYGDRSDYDVWEADRQSQGKYVHPTEKPDWLVMKALKNSSKFNDNIIDLFGGSGSTLMACEKLGRKAFLMELDERFVDVIIYRWEKYTKKRAKKL